MNGWRLGRSNEDHFFKSKRGILQHNNFSYNVLCYYKHHILECRFWSDIGHVYSTENGARGKRCTNKRLLFCMWT